MSTITVQNLSEREKTVLIAVNEFLNQNRQFNIEKVLPFINSRFKKASININNEGIREILKTLIRKGQLVEGSKLSKETILNNDTRKLIYDYIKMNPGTYFNKLSNDLNINNYLITWHIAMLEKFGFIKREILDNRYVYFDINLDIREVKRNYLLSNEKSQKIIFYLKENDSGLTKTQLADALEMHQNTISKYLEDLEEIKVIKKFTEANNKILYFINENYENNS